MINLGILIDDISKSAGTERAVSSLANGLLRYYPGNHKISIISIFNPDLSKTFFELNPRIEIIYLHKKNDFNSLTKFFWYRNLVSDLKNLNSIKHFDVLMGTTYIHNILLGFITKNSKTRSIGCEHEVYNYPPKLIQVIRKWRYPKLDALVVLNEIEKKQYFFSKNIFIIPNSNPIESTEKSDLKKNRIISVGRLTHQKGFDLLIEIAEIIKQKNPNWEFNIFGTGEDEKMLQNKIDVKNLSNIVKLKGLSHSIEQEYLNSSIFLLTSRWESFGLVLIEAMKLGLPVISFECDGPSTIIKDNENGFLIPKFEKELMAEKIIKLIEDKKLREKMGKNSIELSEAYNEKNIMPLWNQLIQSII